MRTMMKKLTVLAVLCLLAIGIAANANIQTSTNRNNENDKVQNFENQSLSQSTKTTSDPAIIVFLLGVGLVSFVTSGRMNPPKNNDHIDKPKK